MDMRFKNVMVLNQWVIILNLENHKIKKTNEKNLKFTIFDLDMSLKFLGTNSSIIMISTFQNLEV